VCALHKKIGDMIVCALREQNDCDFKNKYLK